MTVYGDFARCYANGPWTEFSRRVAASLPAVLERLDCRPRSILDIACGEGTFVVAMANRGYRVTGIDVSPQMLELARKRADSQDTSIDFMLQDMRFLSFSEGFDLVTCWFDSLNYLLDTRDLEMAFSGVYRALKQGGSFLFDMNTVYGLALAWQKQPYYVQVDTDEEFDVGFPSYDRQTRIASLTIKGVVRDGNEWHRLSEMHRERAYTLKEIRQCLRAAGLKEIGCWDSLERTSKPNRGSERAWFVTRK